MPACHAIVARLYKVDQPGSCRIKVQRARATKSEFDDEDTKTLPSVARLTSIYLLIIFSVFYFVFPPFALVFPPLSVSTDRPSTNEIPTPDSGVPSPAGECSTRRRSASC